MTQPWRLPEGGRIDRSHPIEFRWDGRVLSGHEGDTLGSALLANGIHFVARSFKYHRPRGILGAGAEEPNALVTLRAEHGREDPNTRVTQTRLRSGLAAFSQNCWPSLAFDAGVLSSALAPLWSAGFYYKTFMWPRHAWQRLYEPLIRRAAGLGRAPASPDPDRYSTRFAHCDVLIVGAGPAGLAAALAASEAGARVILCDEQFAMGGSLLSADSEQIDGEDAQRWLTQTLATLARRDRTILLPATTAFGYYADNMLGLVQETGTEGHPDLPRQRLWQVRAREVVLATGAIERPIVFPDNDRPGILLASAARTYLNRYAVRVGSAIAVYALHDSGYLAALEIQRRCGGVRAIVDPRENAPADLVTAASDAGIEVLKGHAVTGTRGRHRVRAMLTTPLGYRSARQERWIECDAVLMAGGWTPTLHLFSQSRGALEWNDAIGAFLPGQPRQRTWVAGACRGLHSLAEIVADGTRVGELAARAAAGSRVTVNVPGVEPGPGNSLNASALDEIARRGKSFVDFQNDVCAADIVQALDEGFCSIEHLKRYTTTGMATDQGKTSGINAMTLAGRAQGKSPGQVGTTTFRPPYTPVTFGALAGEHRGEDLDPVRVTPLHEWAVAAGAVFEPVGLWRRARYFPRPGETMADAVSRECRTTRERAGIFDASTLGKIEVVGPDAAEFLDRMYTNPFKTLRVGACRYGLLLKEDGYVLDDGVVARLAENRFHVTTTTGGAARVLHHMEDYLQTEFSDLRVWLTSITEQWAVIAVNGPMARSILEPLVERLDLAPAAFPHMSVREGRICGTPTRLFRVSFTGELGFEVNVPAAAALEVWENIQRQAEQFGAVTYGTESMHVLRAEKGYILVGQETDGTVTPGDLGLGWAIGKAKHDFVGKRSLRRPDLLRAGRKQLVGLLTCDGRSVLEEGAQTLDPLQQNPPRSDGHVTSSYFSAVLGRPIALGLVANGRERSGSVVEVTAPRGTVAARIVEPVFYDPTGERIHV